MTISVCHEGAVLCSNPLDFYEWDMRSDESFTLLIIVNITVIEESYVLL